MKMLKLAGFLLILTITIQYSISFAQAKEDCLMCHDDPEFTTEIDGKEISLNVSEKKFNASVHNKLNCVACHTGYDPEEIPHKEEITPINCLNCHKKMRSYPLFRDK